jgi:hypothetical protein
VVIEKQLAEDRVRVGYEQQLVKLEDQLFRLEDELAAEREMHVKDKKALDHLRTHFSSLPLQHLLPSSVVSEDQLAGLDHLSL